MSDDSPSSITDPRPSVSTMTTTVVDTPSTMERAVMAAIFVLVALLATVMAYVAATGLLSPDAPRTALERSLETMESDILETPDDELAHADYAAALISAEQYSTAERVIERGLGILPDSPAILFQSARLASATGDDGTVPDILVEVFGLIEEARTTFSQDLADRGITGSFTLPYSETLVSAALMQASLREEAGDVDVALESYDLALTEDPSMADVLVLRGNAYLELGMTEEAGLDFEAALRFIPDYEPALQALESLGGE